MNSLAAAYETCQYCGLGRTPRRVGAGRPLFGVRERPSHTATGQAAKLAEVLEVTLDELAGLKRSEACEDVRNPRLRASMRALEASGHSRYIEAAGLAVEGFVALARYDEFEPSARAVARKSLHVQATGSVGGRCELQRPEHVTLRRPSLHLFHRAVRRSRAMADGRVSTSIGGSDILLARQRRKRSADAASVRGARLRHQPN